VLPFGEVRGNVHGSSMTRWKSRGRLPISANWTFFRQLLRSRRYEQILVEIVVFERGLVNLSAISEGRGSYTNEFWRQKTRIPGLSRGIVCIIPFSRFDTIPACERHTHMDCAVEYDGLLHRWIWRWANSPILDEQTLGGHPPTNFGIRKLESVGYHAVLFAWSSWSYV